MTFTIIQHKVAYVIICVIWNSLYYLKNCEKHTWRSVTFSKVANTVRICQQNYTFQKFSGTVFDLGVLQKSARRLFLWTLIQWESNSNKKTLL